MANEREDPIFVWRALAGILVRGRMGEKGTFPSARYSEGSADEG